MRCMRGLVIGLLAAACTLLCPGLVGSAAAATNPSAGPFPPNTNTCRPTAAHPYPVVLVHGTFEEAAQNFLTLAPYLQAQGYCVYALNYGNNATGDIHFSAQQLSDFVDFVLAQTGSSKVDMVGHSQGGLMPRDCINNLGGATKVDKLVGLSPSNHGTTNPFAPGAPNCRACQQQVFESRFIQSVNGSGETRPGIYYTVIETKYDEVVTPYTSAFLNNGANNSQVTNVLLQNLCPANIDDHIATAYDPAVFLIVNNALSQGAAPADPHFNPCALPLTAFNASQTKPRLVVAAQPAGAPASSTTAVTSQPQLTGSGAAGSRGVAPAATPVVGTPTFTG